MAKVTVLICDDAVMYATMLSAWLRDDPAIVVVGTASDGPDAVDAARAHQPDVVLLDHLLGGQDSTVVAPRLREAAPRAAVVLTSGSSDDRLEVAADAAGADGWVAKAAPFDVLRERLLTAAARSA